MDIVFATRNAGKLKEMRAILDDLDINLISAGEAGVKEDIIEDGKTFTRNAFIKADYVCKKTGRMVLAEDSGLCIKALDGAPGVTSARWAGHNASDDELINFTLTKLRDVPMAKRRAYFETALVFMEPDGRHWTFSGKLYGHIALSPRGIARPKLIYDLIFIPDGYDKTLSEMSDSEKNSLSHRGIAMREFKDFLQNKYLIKHTKTH